MNFIFTIERVDVTCPPGCKEYSKSICFDGNGKYFMKGRYENGDKITDLLDKIIFLSNTDNRVVKWRRCMIISLGLGIIISLFHIKTYDIRIHLLTVLLIFMGFYLMYSYYKFHFDVYPTGYIKENISIIKKKLGILENYKIPSCEKESVNRISGTIPTKTNYTFNKKN